jgi:hypothetical protein
MTYVLDLHPQQRLNHHDARRLLPQPPVVCPQPVPLLQQVVEQNLVRCMLRRKVGLPIGFLVSGPILLLLLHGYNVNLVREPGPMHVTAQGWIADQLSSSRTIAAATVTRLPCDPLLIRKCTEGTAREKLWKLSQF